MAHLRRIRKAGKGAYGVVYECMNEETKEHVAVKHYLADRNTDFFACIREIDTIASIRYHPYIVSLKYLLSNQTRYTGAAMSPIKGEYRDDTVHMVLERASLNLEEFLQTPDATPEQLKVIMVSMLLGIEYLHLRGIAHRDIKPANFLISESKGGITLKVADFGMAKHITLQDKATDQLSAAWYRAPEVIDKRVSTTSLDVWAIGCVIFELFMKYALLAHCTKAQDSWIRSEQTNVVRDFSTARMVKTDAEIKIIDATPGPKWKEIVEIAQMCLTIDENKRPTVSSILDLPAFAYFRQHITEIRVAYNKPSRKLNTIVVSHAPIRKLVLKHAPIIYEQLKDKPWFRTRSVFMAIDFFDRYLAYVEEKKLSMPTQERDGLFVFAVCFYLSMNYHIVSGCSIRFAEVCKWFIKDVSAQDTSIVAIRTAEFLMCNVMIPGDVYRPTVLEMGDVLGKVLTDEKKKDLLNYMCDNTPIKGTAMEIFSSWLASRSSPNTVKPILAG